MAFLLTGCDPDRLKLLVDDRLSPDETIGLEQHLEQCPRCRETLDGLVGSDRCLEGVREFLGDEPADAFEASGHASESLHFLAPSDWPDSMGRLGTYEVKGILGRGGMGIVLKAFDPALNRNVAIKVLSASLATTGAARCAISARGKGGGRGGARARRRRFRGPGSGRHALPGDGICLRAIAPGTAGS